MDRTDGDSMERGAGTTVLPRDAWLEEGWAILDAAGCVAAADPSMCRWLGYPDTSELVGQPLSEILEARCAGWGALVKLCLANANPFGQAELSTPANEETQIYRLQCSQHQAIKHVRLSSSLPPLKQLQEESWANRTRYGQAGQRVLARLMTAESQLERLVGRWPGVIFSQRADFSYDFISPKIEELTGIPVAKWMAQPKLFRDIVHEADLEELEREIKRLTHGQPQLSTTFRIRHSQTGRVSYVFEHREAVVSRKGLVLGYDGFWLDVTRQTIAEKRLFSSAWKETLSVLTMGLAHDFSNILAGIHSLSENFVAQLEPEHPLQEGLSLIKRNSMQANQLVRRILSLHRDQVGERQYQDLNELLQETLELLRKIIPRRIEVKVVLSAETLPVYVDPIEFRQILVNLLLNAIDSMPDKGVLTLETSRQAGPTQLPHVHGRIHRYPAVCLSIKDTGCGISKPHLDLIFDPFFTTKAVHKGSGLGLYNSLLAVEKHDGAIAVSSTEGKGSEFQVWLPQADFTESERISAQVQTLRHTLLLAGSPGPAMDEITQILRHHGFYVVSAPTEIQGIELLCAPEYHFTVLLVLAASKADCHPKLIKEALAVNPPLKLAVLTRGCNPDELDLQLLSHANLMLSAETPLLDVVNRIKGLVLENA